MIQVWATTVYNTVMYIIASHHRLQLNTNSLVLITVSQQKQDFTLKGKKSRMKLRKKCLVKLRLIELFGVNVHILTII